MKRSNNYTSKIIISLFIVFNLFLTTNSSAEGEPGRYIDSIFPVINITRDVTFTQNKDLNGQAVDLKFDLYEPAADTQARRPLIIFMHHGSFQNGTRTDAEAVQFTNYFAKRGYVTVSASYRLGIENLLDPVSHLEAVFRAVQDARAAVRYLRKNAAQYRIDTSKIYIGGGSAGAITAIHSAYLTPNTVPSYLDQVKLGGLDSGGNPGISTKVHGVVNVFGAIVDTSWITASGAPIVSVHGEKDQVVPFKHASFGQFSLYGSFYIHQRAKNVDVRNKLQSFPNSAHGFEAKDSGKIDTSYRVIRDFLYTLTTGKDTIITSLQNQQKNHNEISIFPNPANDFITIKNITEKNITSVSIIGLDGKEKVNYNNYAGAQNEIQLSMPLLPKGIYLLKMTIKEGQTEIRKIVIQ